MHLSLREPERASIVNALWRPSWHEMWHEERASNGAAYYNAHMATTSRQDLALYLYYVQGHSYRQIGKALGIEVASSYTLVKRGRESIIRSVERQGANTSPLVRALLAANESAVSCTRHIGRALTRQEELLDALQLRLEQHEAELAMYEQWLSGNSSSPSHCKKNAHDQWELRYLQQHRNGGCLPSSAYDGHSASRACGSDRERCAQCGLDCAWAAR